MRSDGKNTYLLEGLNKDVVRCVVECYRKWREQPLDIVDDLYGLDICEQSWDIFNYLIENVRYKEDEAGYQWIKSPARLLADGEGDCKSMSLFIASCLHCLGRKGVFRFVNFDGSDQWTHVYIVVVDGNKELILDAVERDSNGMPVFDYARSYKKKLDIEF